MKITANNVSIECSDDLFQSKNSTKNIIDVINALNGAAASAPIDFEKKLEGLKITTGESSSTTQSYNVGERLDRQRLPNTDSPREELKSNARRLDNVVDLKDLKLEKPNSTNYFRCPDCGQSVFLHINEKFYIKSLDTGMIYPVDIDENTEINTYKDYQDLLLTSVGNEPITICDTDEVESFCIKCGKTHTLHDYIDAYENPDMYFENEKICPLCGGEVCDIVGTDGVEAKCEKCDYKEEVKND